MIFLKIINYRTISSFIVLLLCLLILLGQCNKSKKNVQRKLIGTWNIEIDSSFAKAPQDWFGTLIEINENNSLELPVIYNDDFEKMERESLGVWGIISTNPDSIFFSAPNNPLNGKYAIHFYKSFENKYFGRKYYYKMNLSNDSTVLICFKGGILFDRDVSDW